MKLYSQMIKSKVLPGEQKFIQTEIKLIEWIRFF